MSAFPFGIRAPKACPSCGHRQFERGHVYSSHEVSFKSETHGIFANLKRAFTSGRRLYGFVCERCRRVELYTPKDK